MDAGMLWIIAAGLLEPVWVITLKKFDEDRRIVWLAATVFFAAGTDGLGRHFHRIDNCLFFYTALF